MTEYQISVRLLKKIKNKTLWVQTLRECAAHAYGSNRPKDSHKATALRVTYYNTTLNRSPCTFQGFVTNQHSRYIYLPSCKTLYDVMQGHK